MNWAHEVTYDTSESKLRVDLNPSVAPIQARLALGALWPGVLTELDGGQVVVQKGLYKIALWRNLTALTSGELNRRLRFARFVDKVEKAGDDMVWLTLASGTIQEFRELLVDYLRCMHAVKAAAFNTKELAGRQLLLTLEPGVNLPFFKAELEVRMRFGA